MQHDKFGFQCYTFHDNLIAQFSNGARNFVIIVDAETVDVYFSFHDWYKDNTG